MNGNLTTTNWVPINTNWVLIGSKLKLTYSHYFSAVSREFGVLVTIVNSHSYLGIYNISWPYNIHTLTYTYLIQLIVDLAKGGPLA